MMTTWLNHAVLETKRVRVIVLWLLCTASPVFSADLTAVRNLAEQCRGAQSKEKVCVVYVSQPGCPYCARMEKEVLGPLQKVPWLMESIELFELGWEFQQVAGFDSQWVSGSELMAALQVSGAPTLVFLDGEGNPLTDPILGYQSPDFFWFYLERAIDLANQQLAQSKKASSLGAEGGGRASAP